MFQTTNQYNLLQHAGHDAFYRSLLRRWCLPPSHRSAPAWLWGLCRPFCWPTLRKRLPNWRQNWKGLPWEWDPFSGQRSFGLTKSADNSEPTPGIAKKDETMRTLQQALHSNWCHLLENSCVWLYWLLSDSGLDQNWVTKTFFKATTSRVLACAIFFLVGKDPQLLRVLKWHWKLTNLHSTGREWLLPLPPFASISLLEKTSFRWAGSSGTGPSKCVRNMNLPTKKIHNKPQWSTIHYNRVM